jgi:hypothetical protein
MVNDDHQRTVNCEQVWRELSNYLEGELEAGLRAAMDDHFHSCRACASLLAGTRNVIRLYGDERMIDVPHGFAQRLEKRLLRAARGSRHGWSTWSAWLVPVAALLLFAGGLRFAASSTSPPPLQSAMAQPAHGIPADLVVVVTAGAKEFHRPGCGVIHNPASARTLTAKEAVAQGYVPCPRCLRKYLQMVATGNGGENEDQANLAADLDRKHPASR